MDNLTQQEIDSAFENNPEVTSMLFTMSLFERSHQQTDSIMDSLYEGQKKENERLRKELAYYKPLAYRFLQIQNALTTYREDEV